MTSQELEEHVARLAHDLDVGFWICLTCPGGEYGQARIEVTGDRTAFVNGGVDHPTGYLIALHELGHHADPKWPGGRRLDREAAAWRWALDNTLTPPTQADWALIARNLQTYANDRRYKRTPAFIDLLAEAERNST